MQGNYSLAKYYFFIGILGLISLTVIIFGFVYAGNPFAQKDISYDKLRMIDFSTIRSKIENYGYKAGKLPVKLTDLVDYDKLPTDPKTKKEYGYQLVSKLNYQLCADFATEVNEEPANYSSNSLNYAIDRKHKKGYSCVNYDYPEYMFQVLATPTPYNYYPAGMTNANSQPRLTAYWSFEKDSKTDFYDMSGNRNDGIIYNAYVVSDSKGNALAFNGETSYLQVASGNSFRFGRNDPFAVSAWIMPAKTGQMSIFSKMDDRNYFPGYEFYINHENRLGAYLINIWPTNAISVSATTPVNDGGWHQAAFSYDGSGKAGGIRIYLDGKEEKLTVEEDSLTGGLENSILPNIGSRNGKNYFFNGSIDEVKVYNYAPNLSTFLEDFNNKRSIVPSAAPKF